MEEFQWMPRVLGQSEGERLRVELSTSLSSDGIRASRSGELDLHFLSVRHPRERRAFKSEWSCSASARVAAPVRQSST